jgi:hypothetical protein
LSTFSGINEEKKPNPKRFWKKRLKKIPPDSPLVVEYLIRCENNYTEISNFIGDLQFKCKNDMFLSAVIESYPHKHELAKLTNDFEIEIQKIHNTSDVAEQTKLLHETNEKFAEKIVEHVGNLGKIIHEYNWLVQYIKQN